REARAEVDAHVDGCDACRLLLARMAPLLSHAGVPPPETTRPERDSITETRSVDEARWKASLRVGTVLSGKWRLDGLLGVGGMAAVYAATHQNNGTRAAIKLVHRAVAEDPAA